MAAPPTHSLPHSILLCVMINHRNRRGKMLSTVKDICAIALIAALCAFIWVATPADHDLSAQKQEIANVR